jgi:hypothetical protein
LLTGDESNGYVIATLVDNAQAAAGQANFTVPNVPKNEKLYWVQLHSPEVPSKYMYSHKFVVKGDAPPLSREEIKQRQEEQRKEKTANKANSGVLIAPTAGLATTVLVVVSAYLF